MEEYPVYIQGSSDSQGILELPIRDREPNPLKVGGDSTMYILPKTTMEVLQNSVDGSSSNVNTVVTGRW